MPDDQFKVPEGVLDAFRNAHPFALVPADKGGRIESALAAALAQHHKELLGDEARTAIADAVDKLSGPLGRAHVRAEKDSAQERELAEVVEQIGEIREALEPGLQAAIDSVMKGGDGG